MERYEASAGESSHEEQGEAVQEVEEELSVGKRKVASGGVRVTTSVSEQPVEETVTLREEQVEVERRPADRKLKPEEAEAAFQDKTVEMLGTSEEVEVSKEAHVVGEVALGKRVEEHEEKVKDTVRRSEVEVEKIKPSSRQDVTLQPPSPQQQLQAKPGARAHRASRSGEDDDRSCIPGRVEARAPRDGPGPAWSGAAAAALGAAALYNGYRARQVERRHPPAGRFIEVDGVRLHYLERGAGTPVVLLHGNVVTAEDWILSGVLDQVAARGHRVIAFDRPGYGYSDRPRHTAWTAAAQADLLRRAFARLGIERPVVVGHSWGTLAALALAFADPAAVRGLVLVSGYYYPTVRADALLVAPAAVPVLGDVLRHTVSPLFGAATLPLLLKGMFAPLPVPERFQQGFARGMAVRPWQIRAEAEDGAGMAREVGGDAGPLWGAASAGDDHGGQRGPGRGCRPPRHPAPRADPRTASSGWCPGRGTWSIMRCRGRSPRWSRRRRQVDTGYPAGRSWRACGLPSRATVRRQWRPNNDLGAGTMAGRDYQLHRLHRLRFELGQPRRSSLQGRRGERAERRPAGSGPAASRRALAGDGSPARREHAASRPAQTGGLSLRAPGCPAAARSRRPRPSRRF